MIRWTITRIADSVEQSRQEVPLSSTTLAVRKIMLAQVAAMLEGQPEDVKAATIIPSLSAPTSDRCRQFAVFLGGDPADTTYVLVDAWRSEMYP